METFFSSRRAGLWAGVILSLAALLAYQNTFGAPFVLDDKRAIEENPTIRHLASALTPPPGALTVSGRPVLNLTLAMNYWVSGGKVWSYHAVNLLIHVLAGLTLFGIVRRTLARTAAQPVDSTRCGYDTAWPALAVALLWTVHPLQTESVTYIVERAESLMGLFYLLTLYCFIRGAEENESGQPAFAKASAGEKAARRVSFFWFGLSWLACLFGMGTKEVMVSAPLIVLLYDRAFISGSWGEAWRRRRHLYMGLAGTWILLACLVISNGDHAGTAGFNLPAGAGAYWLTQFPAVARYLGLSAWPHPLTFDYGTQWVRSWPTVAPAALLVGSLVAGTAAALWRNSALGFLGAWFFAILAPTSLVPGAVQTMAERRMYLPLAAVLALAMAAMMAGVGRYPSWRKPCQLLLAGVALAYAVTTLRRNADYRSDLTLWSDTVAKVPDNARAHNNLATAYSERGSFAEAIAQYEEAVRLDPDSVYVRLNFGDALEHLGRLPEAIAQYQRAVLLKPDWAGAQNNLAEALTHTGRLREAISHYERALRINPGYPQAENGLGAALFRSGATSDAIAHLQAALRIDPDYAEADNNLGTVLASVNRLPEAIDRFQRALRLKPDYPEAHLNLGNAFYEAGRLTDAIREYGEALRLRPGSAEMHDHFGILLAEAGRLPEAEAQFQEALRLNPDDREGQENLRRLQVMKRMAVAR